MSLAGSENRRLAPAVGPQVKGGKLVALVGNPNCGKTALFNRLTGSRQKVANYAGATVEKKEGLLSQPDGRALRVLDLPGIYSLYPRSEDERVACAVLSGHSPGEKRPDALVCVVDATNLRRGLRLVLAVQRLGLPCLVVLNMADLAERRGLKIDVAALSAQLGLPVVRSVAVQSGGDAEVRAWLAAEPWRQANPMPVGVDQPPQPERAPDHGRVEADHAQVQALVWADFAQAEVHAMANQGRDIRPFMAALPLLLARRYEAVLKLHSKKSLHRGDGELWRKTLIAQLLPSGPALPALIESLRLYPSLGLIAPEGNVLNIQRYIGSNQPWVDRLVAELGEGPDWLVQARPWFAAGTMFWFKPQAVQSLLHCPSIQQDAFEIEKGQIDGTLAHAIERVLGCATLAHGYHLIDTRLAKGIGSPDAKIRRQAQKDWANEWSCKGRQRTVDSPFARPTETAS